MVDRPAVPPRSYTDDEVEAIFRRALEQQQARADGLGHEELIAAAREVGLDDDAVERAIEEVGRDRQVDEVRNALRTRRRQRWLRHLFAYLVVVGAFLGLHFVGLVGAWVYWMAFGWGIGVALSSVRGLRSPNEDEVEREVKRINRRERRKAKAIARRDAAKARAEARHQDRGRREDARRRRTEAGAELERVIDEGVALLLGAAAKKLNEAARKPTVNDPRSDFARYVARKKGQPVVDPPAEATEAAPAPRYRVEVPPARTEDRPRTPRPRPPREEEQEVERDERPSKRRRR